MVNVMPGRHIHFSLAQHSSDTEAIDNLPVAYLELDTHGVVTRANRACLELYPKEDGGPVGRIIWDFVPTEDKERSCAAFFLLMETGDEPPVIRRTLFTRSGEFRILELHRSLIRDAAGMPTGLRSISVDVTEVHLAHEEADRKVRWHEDILDSMSDGMMITDTLGYIHYINPAAEGILGWKSKDLCGKIVEKAFTILSYISPEQETLNHQTVLARPTKGVVTVLTCDNRQVRVEICTSPIRQKESHSVEGVVSILRKLEEIGA